MATTIGIDLGTTSCVCSVFDGKNVRVLPDKKGHRMTPSYMAVTASRRIVVGHDAKQQAVTNPEGTVTAFKRLLARPMQSPEVQTLLQRSSYPIQAGPQGHASAFLHGRLISPVEMAANVLRELREGAEAALGDSVSKAVITVPANYNEIQRQATFLAARMAGLTPLRLLNEPTAAALAYSAMPGGGNRTIAIFDLGGGTFDVTLMRIEDDVFEVLATCGDTFLGGEDFDSAIVSHWMEQIKTKDGIDLAGNAGAMLRLREAAESVKVSLSGQPAALADLPHLAAHNGQPFHFQGSLTRSVFGTLTKHVVQRTLRTCEEALKLAGISVRQIDDVVLVGGMTRAPSVQRAITEYFGRAPVKGIHPEEAVSAGAARYAYTLSGGATSQVLLDVLPHTLSVVSMGKCRPLLTRGTRLPAKRSENYSTSDDNQRSVKVRVVQGEHENPDDNVLLGVFDISDLPLKPRGGVKLKIEFFVTTNGLLEVTATDTETGTEYVINVSESLRAEDVLQLTPSA